MSTDETKPPSEPTPPESAKPHDNDPLGIADALKRGFAEYLEKNNVRPETGSELNVDLEFMKSHTGPLLAHLLRSATQQVVPKDLRFTVATPPPKDKPGAAPVNVNFDLGDFLSRLFNPPTN